MQGGRLSIFRSVGLFRGILGSRRTFLFMTHACVSLLLVPICRTSSSAYALEIADVTFVAFDIETTGFSPRSDRIVEIAAVKFQNGKILEAASWLVNPGTPIPASATRIHGITDGMAQNGRSTKQALNCFKSFIGDAVLVAHNAAFDVRFIEAEARRAGMDLPDNTVIDSILLARSWFPRLESYALPAVVKHLKLAEGPYHRALADSHYVASILAVGIKAMPKGAGMEDLIAAAGTTTRLSQPGSRHPR